jgi:hypothetical protein
MSPHSFEMFVSCFVGYFLPSPSPSDPVASNSCRGKDVHPSGARSCHRSSRPGHTRWNRRIDSTHPLETSTKLATIILYMSILNVFVSRSDLLSTHLLLDHPGYFVAAHFMIVPSQFTGPAKISDAHLLFWNYL